MDTYEKKYNELVEKLKKASVDNDWCDERFCCVISSLFPELRESEDEKIRKELIEFVDINTLSIDERHNRWIAWLKKQGEQKPAWSENDKKFMYDTISNLTELKERYGEGYGNVGKCIDWLKQI